MNEVHSIYLIPKKKPRTGQRVIWDGAYRTLSDPSVYEQIDKGAILLVPVADLTKWIWRLAFMVGAALFVHRTRNHYPCRLQFMDGRVVWLPDRCRIRRLSTGLLLTRNQ